MDVLWSIILFAQKLGQRSRDGQEYAVASHMVAGSSGAGNRSALIWLPGKPVATGRLCLCARSAAYVGGRASGIRRASLGPAMRGLRSARIGGYREISSFLRPPHFCRGYILPAAQVAYCCLRMRQKSLARSSRSRCRSSPNSVKISASVAVEDTSATDAMATVSDSPGSG